MFDDCLQELVDVSREDHDLLSDLVTKDVGRGKEVMSDLNNHFDDATDAMSEVSDQSALLEVLQEMLVWQS